MAINIKNAEADRLARELSEITGETITEAVIKSLAERLEREKNKQTTSAPLEEELLSIAKRYQALPTLDTRTEEEILGYNDGY
jgi:antitoxin VapB